MGGVLLRAEYWLKVAGHYTEPVRLMLFFYKCFCWLIKLPGRAVSAYREVRDGFRFLRDLPQRMVEDFVRAVVVGLAAAVGTALSAMAAKVVRPALVIGLVALFGMAVWVIASKRSAGLAA